MSKDFSPTPGQWEQGPDQYYDMPPPAVEFYGNSFVLTGIFALGERPAVEKAITDLGGRVSRLPPKSGCYVVVGTLPSKQWIRSDAGRKLLTALELREEGYFVAIISEDHFVEALIKAQNDHTTKPQIDFQPSYVTWEKHLHHWFGPLLEEFPLEICASEKAAGYTVHPVGKERQWLCRIRCSLLGNPVSIEVKGHPKEWVPFKRNLPKDIILLLRPLVEAASVSAQKDTEPKRKREHQRKDAGSRQ